jgi:hypothetical protein
MKKCCHAKEKQMKNLIHLLFVLVCLSTGFSPLMAQWTPIDSTGSSAVLSLSVAADGSKIFAGTNGAGVYYSSNNGSTWTGASTSLGGSHVRTFAVYGSNLFAGTENGVYLTLSSTIGTGSWAGWSAKNSGLTDKNILSLVVSADGMNVYAGTSSGVFRSSDNGTNWTAVNSGLTSTYVTALGVSGANLFATTLGGVFLSTNNGSSWTPINSGLTNSNVYTIAVSGTNLFVGTDDGVFISSNNGTTWSAANTGLTSIDVNCLLVSGSSLFVGTFSGGVFLSTNNGTNWHAVNTSLTNAYVNTLAVNGPNLYVGTSTVTVVQGVGGEPGTLPVELTSFTVTTGRNAATLKWKTATEVNNYGFDVERSAAAAGKVQNSASAVWVKVGFVEGHGTINTAQSYNFVDNSAAGSVVYRIKQIDRDGKFKYSQEVNATVSAPHVYELSQNYPNPFNPSTTISFTVPADGRAVLKVYNIVGQEIGVLFDGQAEAGKYNQVQFNASGLASGVYFSRLEYDGKVQLKKMQLLK